VTEPSSRDPEPEAPRNVLPDLIIPLMALAFSVYYLTTITEVPWIAQASAVVVSGLLFCSILAFAARTVSRLRSGREVVRLGGLAIDRRNDPRRAGLLGLSIAYVWFIEDFGFTITTAVFLFLAVVLLSSPANWRNAALVAVVSSLIGYFVFVFVFETRFPEGPVESFLEPYAESTRRAIDGG
jgi:Tripartite tricarboxylate transporter TctB family